MDEFMTVVRAGNFEMPSNRLLTIEEAKILKQYAYQPVWIKCKQCKELGATTNPDQQFCSLKCQSDQRLFDPSEIQVAMDLVEQNNYAQAGDTVLYAGKRMFVYATDCTNERLRKPYPKTFTYVLICDCELLVVKDLKEGLRRMNNGLQIPD